MLESGKWKVESVKRWLRWLPLLLTLSLFHPFTTAAQEMRVDGFEKLKKGPLNMNHVVTDKQQAILDLKTGEKGFSFLADGKTEIAAEENDGMLTLKTPDKTRFVVIKHADYGQLTWKAPLKKGLRKKKHYAATLLTFSPEKNYQLQEQWVIFDTQPWDVILTVDSTMTTVHGGRAQMFLPIGKHTWKAESPFYMQEEGSFELANEERLNVAIALQPVYSYLTVKTPCPDCGIYVDGQHIGQAQATSGHLREGVHHLTLMRGDQPYYEGDFSIGWKEKKTIELTMDDIKNLELRIKNLESGKWKEESERGNSLCGRMFYYEGESMSVRVARYQGYDDTCPEHEQWSPVQRTTVSVTTSVGDALQCWSDELDVQGSEVTMCLTNDCFVDYVSRRDNDQRTVVMLPGRRVEDFVGQDAELGGLPLSAFYQHEYRHIDAAFPYPELTLAQLGIPPRDIVRVTAGGKEAFFELRIEN